MNFKIVSTLYKKEIVDIFRDKKTIMIMLVVPLLLYPVLMLFAAQISVSFITEAQEKTYSVGIDFDESREEIIEIFNDRNDEYEYSFNVVDTEDYALALENKQIDAYLTLDKSGDIPVYQINYLSSVTESNNVSAMLEDMLLVYRNKLRAEKIEALGGDAKIILNPVAVEYKDTASSEQSVGYLLGSILPAILVVIITMSATYPATDITAGEKERGTLETILTLPVKSQEIFMSKFLAVTTIAVCSAFVNIASMGIVAGYLYTSVLSVNENNADINISSFVPAFIIVMLCVVVFATFVSALTMGVCSTAKSFKEAQNYMTPLTFIIMMIGYASFVPSVKLDIKTAVIPILNVSLLIKQLFSFEYNFLLIAIVFVSNLLYALIAVLIIGKIYNSENIMFEENGSGIKLFERRADIKAGGYPGQWDAVIILLLTMISILYLSVAGLKIGVLWGIILPQLFCAAVCIVSAVYLKCDLKKTFSIKIPTVKQFIGGIIFGLGMVCINMIVSQILEKLFGDSAANLTQSVDMIYQNSDLIQRILVIGLLPAICEEILFRGYFYSSIKEKMKPVTAMIIVSAVFGLYHMNLVQSLGAGIIGMFLVIALSRTECIFIPMIMHFMNNSLSVIISEYSDSAAMKFLDENMNGIGSVIFIIGGILFTGLGFLLLKGSKAEQRIFKE